MYEDLQSKRVPSVESGRTIIIVMIIIIIILSFSFKKTLSTFFPVIPFAMFLLTLSNDNRA